MSADGVVVLLHGPTANAVITPFLRPKRQNIYLSASCLGCDPATAYIDEMNNIVHSHQAALILDYVPAMSPAPDTNPPYETNGLYTMQWDSIGESYVQFKADDSSYSRASSAFAEGIPDLLLTAHTIMELLDCPNDPNYQPPQAVTRSSVLLLKDLWGIDVEVIQPYDPSVDLWYNDGLGDADWGRFGHVLFFQLGLDDEPYYGERKPIYARKTRHYSPRNGF